MSGEQLTRYRCVMLRRSGASEIRIVRAEDAAAARARLAAAGLDPVSIEPIGPSLFDMLGERIARGGWRFPRLRPAWPARLARPSGAVLTGAALLLATVPFTTAIGAWGLVGLDRWQAARIAKRQAPAIAASVRVAAVERARDDVEAVMAVPSMSGLAGRLRALLPEEAGLVAMALAENGALTVEVETPDPDRLRTALAADPLFGALREIGQTRTEGATIDVILTGRVR
ncbi:MULTISPECIES: hypothetical protein [unclassified Sphingomonas]|uniref:hypothetical protein n=2 Tax=Sphingomonas TaxID=13687 RepID=UPI0006F909B8|nr:MULTISPECIES: hypothetical protein [unclassified Sphingomonas]KRB88238.1 hypothetical protein ASE22_22655 [Sphingomonas sp. Root720]